MAMTLIQSVEAEQLKADVPSFGPGDTVRVHVKVVEGNRERIQVFEGVVIRRRAGGANENFTVRRSASHGIGVERTFLINSPRIDRIEVVRTGRVRRSKLYYLRGRTGRAARIRERRRPVGSLALRGARASTLVAAGPEIASLEEKETVVDQSEKLEAASADDALVTPADAEDVEDAVTEVPAADEAAAPDDAEESTS